MNLKGTAILYTVMKVQYYQKLMTEDNNGREIQHIQDVIPKILYNWLIQ